MKAFSARLSKLFKDQLKAGTSPQKLAITFALGGSVSCCPLFGITTPLCVVLALAFRLNLALLQLVNYLFAPAQITLLPIYFFLGSKLFHLPLKDFNPLAMKELLFHHPAQFASQFGKLVLSAGALYALSFPVFYFILYGIAQILLKSFYRKGERLPEK